MNKKIYIVLIVFFIFLTIAVSALVFVNRKNTYTAKIQEVNDQISQNNEAIAKLNSEKDVNGYLPSDVVRNFMNELINDSKEKAKLYVTTTKKEQDLNAWLKITDPFTQINTTSVEYTALDDEATVSYDGYIKDQNNSFSRVFELVKVEDIWKISDIEGS